MTSLCENVMFYQNAWVLKVLIHKFCMLVELVAFFQVKLNLNDKNNCLDFSKWT